jgi:hypothetical protein
MRVRNDGRDVAGVDFYAFKIVRHGPTRASRWEVSPGAPWAAALLRRRGVRGLISQHRGSTYTNPVLSVSFPTRARAVDFLAALELKGREWS